jgi:hypothetical protein
MEYYKSIKSSEIVFYGSAKGHLGASLTFDELEEHDVIDESIGSMNFKIETQGKKVSVLLFRNGKMKVCGGYPISVVLSNKASTYEAYIDGILPILSEVLKKTCGVKELSCLNGQIHITPFKTTSMLDTFIKSKTSSFFCVTEPQLDIPGRRGAYKLYLRRGFKTHAALDVKGKAQIFGAKSFDELFYFFDVLRM